MIDWEMFFICIRIRALQLLDTIFNIFNIGPVKYSSFYEYVCTFKVGTYYLFMQVMTKTHDRTLGSYSGLMVELLKVTVKKIILGTEILWSSTISQQQGGLTEKGFWVSILFFFLNK